MNIPSTHTTYFRRCTSIGAVLLCLSLAATSVAAGELAPPLQAPFSAEQAAAAQRTWASQLKTEVETRNSVGATMTLIPPGAYLMGSTEPAQETAAFAVAMGLSKAKASDHADEHPQHLVRIARPFRIAKHEVTRANFQTFVSDTGYRTEAEKDGQGGWGWDQEMRKFLQAPRFDWRNVGFAQSDDHPVVNVSWNDAQSFCQWLAKKERQTYRLPTEAEWEFANRAGTQSRYQCGNDPECLASIANVADGTSRETYREWRTIAAKDGFIYTSPVGSLKANPFGLCDMHGNVWEWCNDFYDAKYYAQSPAENPAGPSTGALRVSRGGAWSRTPVNCRSCVRRSGSPTLKHVNIGFRPVLVLMGN